MTDITRQVVVVGGGPAGLLAAHAAAMRGFDPCILVPGLAPSHISGAQYLHKPIPNLTDLKYSFTLRYERHGTAAAYAHKIYGGKVAPEDTSWSAFPDSVEAWDLRSMYNILWKAYEDNMVDRTFVYDRDMNIMRKAAAVVCTAPLPQVAGRRFAYSTEFVKVCNDWLPNEVYYNRIVYYGDDAPWYRASNVNGSQSTEWPSSFEDEDLTGPNEKTMVKIRKPVKAIDRTGARASLPGVLLVGRYGKWQKGVLVDHAFRDTLNALR